MESSLPFRTASNPFTTDSVSQFSNPFATDSVSQFSNPFATDSVSEVALKENLIFETPSSVLNAGAVKNRQKSRLVPTTTHPLSQQTPTSSNVSSNVHNTSPVSKREQSLATLCSENDVYLLFKAQGLNVFKKRRSLPGSDIATDAHGNNIELEKKKTVIVHVVKPSDTLAGVALFYGIELSILKRANKLWTNDSIHLRKDLYIPLEHCKVTADKANVMVQENHITIMNRSSALESSHPSTSSSTTLFTTCNDSDNVSDLPGASTSNIWSSPSPSSTSSSLSNLNETVVSDYTNYTRAEIQQLSSAQLSYFPPHLSTAYSANPNPTVSETPSPTPVTYISKGDSIVDKLFDSLSSAGKKYRKGFSSVKFERRKTAWNNRHESSISLTKKRV